MSSATTEEAPSKATARVGNKRNMVDVDVEVVARIGTRVILLINKLLS